MLVATLGEHFRGHVREGAVRPVVVIGLALTLDDAAHLAETDEPVLRQALVAVPTIHALDVGALHRLFEPDEAQDDAVPGRECLPRPAGELWAVIGADNLGKAPLWHAEVVQARA